MSEQNNTENVELKDDRFILFMVGKELYGTPLLDVREVVEYQEPKYMPNMVKHFSGVINIRGAIVGVLDLRKRFNEEDKVSKTTTMLVCDTPQGAIAAVVDKVDSVANITDQSIDKKPPIVSTVTQDYLVGVGKVKDRLVTIVQLYKLLSDEKLVKMTA